MPLKIKKLTEEHFFQMQNDWQKLLSQSSADPLFLSWFWQYHWWQTWSKKLNLELLLLAVYDDNKLIGIAPLYTCYFKMGLMSNLKRLQFIGNAWRLSDTVRTEYMDFIIAHDKAREVENVLFDYICNQEKWHEWIINDVNLNHLFYGHLRQRAKKCNLYVRHISQDEGVKIDCEQSFSGYLQCLGKNTRLKVFNYRKKLLTVGDVEVDRVTTPMQLDDAFEQLNYLHQIRWGGPCFSDDAVAFHTALAKKMLANNCLQFSTIKLDSKIISVLYNIVVQGREYNIQSGFNDQCLHRMSLGSLHLGYAIERAFQSKECHSFDFLAGNGMNTDYKKQYKGERTFFKSVLLVRDPLLRLIYLSYELTPNGLKKRLSRLFRL